MRSLIIIGLLIVCAVAIGKKTAPKLPSNQKALKVVSKSSGLFAGKFFENVFEKNPRKNLITSPLSASVVLAMTQFGARGNTQKQMRSALHLPINERVSKVGYRNLINSFTDVANVTLKIANKIFVNEGLQMKKQFREITHRVFRSAVQQVNFANSAQAVGIINKWADSQTNHKIEKILNEGDVSSDTQLVLCNALYFKGNWAEQFNAKYTMRMDFYLDAHTVTKLSMMVKMSRLNFGELPNLDATWFELPYQNKDLSMIAIVPDAVDGLAALVKGLANYTIRDIKQNGRYDKVQIFLPKFKIESTVELNEPLKQMGMTDMFTHRADFSAIAGVSGMEVDQVIQKAFIEVNEEGSEAAAVTALGVSTRMLGSGPPTISANRPFVIIIQKNDIALFEGVVVDPEQEHSEQQKPLSDNNHQQKIVESEKIRVEGKEYYQMIGGDIYFPTD